MNDSTPNLTTIDHVQSGEIAVLGIPFDENSSFLRGPALAPERIRQALFSYSANLWTENGTDLETASNWQLLADLDLADATTAFANIENTIGDLLQRGARVLSLGGDHSITYPILRAYAAAFGELTILQLDAHPDLYDELDGNRFSHACPFARIMEEKLAARLVQVGIRTLTGHQKQQAHRFDVEQFEMKNEFRIEELQLDGPVYLSLDMDCLDPAFAPGVSHHEPGGMSTRDVLTIIQNLGGNLVGADIVELNPQRDPTGITEMAAAKLLKEIIARMLEENSSTP